MTAALRWAGRVLLVAAVLFGVASPAARAADVDVVRHDLRVELDPATRALAGFDTITVASPAPFTLVLDARYRVESAHVDGRSLAAPTSDGGVQRWRIDGGSGPRKVVVKWRGSVEPLDTALDHRQTLGPAVPVAALRGSFLSSGSRWYPSVPGALERHAVTLELPPGQRGLVPGRLVEEREDADGYRARFVSDAPGEGIDLIAGPYRVASRTVTGRAGQPLLLRTYFHPEIAELSAGYLDDVARYLELYERTIGPYPFAGFSVVSSPTPTGFGMPTLTYLGIDVLRLPFIRATSLGHEVLHNWWGNGVYPDYARGNWSEGLTTFMADYAYKEAEGAEAAREARLGWLRNLAAVPPGQDRPLATFTSRTHGTSQIVGYDKPAMMFFMLRDAIGKEAFEAGVRRFYSTYLFRVASWDDLRRAFEEVSGRDLGPFFRQWLERPGVPTVRLEAATVDRDASGLRVRVRLAQTQSGEPFRLRVPLVLRTDAGDERHDIELGRASAEVAIETSARPRAVLLDPELRLMRRLGSDEAPPVLRRVIVDPETRTVLLVDADASEAARTLAVKLQDHPPRMVDAREAPPDAPVLVIATGDAADRWLARHGLPGRPGAAAGRGTAAMWTTVRPRAGPLVVVAARDAAALEALTRPLPHYGRQSYVVFDGGKAVDRGVWPARPQELRFD